MPPNLLPSQILRKAFDAKKQARTGTSMRKLAHQLGWSTAFLSKVLSGKASLPSAKINKVIEVFDLDFYASKALKKALTESKLKGLSTTNDEDPSTKKKSVTRILGQNLVKYQDIYAPRPRERVLSAWYHLPILDSMTCVNFDSKVDSIAKRFGLTPFEVQSSLRLLDDVGLAKCVDGKWSKATEQINFPTKISEDTIRTFHTQTLKRAIEKMNKSHDSESFARRLITSSSIAVNSKNIPKAKEILMSAVTECVEVLTEGECDEVFNLSIAFFSHED